MGINISAGGTPSPALPVRSNSIRERIKGQAVMILDAAAEPLTARQVRMAAPQQASVATVEKALEDLAAAGAVTRTTVQRPFVWNRYTRVCPVRLYRTPLTGRPHAS